MVNPNPAYYNRVKINNDTTVFQFDSMIEYTRFTNDVQSVAEPRSNARRGFNRINDANYITSGIRQNGISWFGTIDESLVNNNVTSYLFNDRVDAFLDSLKSSTINLDVIDIDQKKQLQFTEQEIGIFSFDLASLGLIPVYEFYSQLLDKIVSPNLVLVEKDDKGNYILDSNGDKIFYHIHQPKIIKHFVSYNTKQGGWYSDILQMVISKDNLSTDDGIDYFVEERKEIQKHIVQRKNKLNDKGEKQFITTWKKCFVHIPKVEKTLPRIDIIVNSAFSSNINAVNEMIYSSMSAICIAQKLSNANVDYRLIASYGTTTAGSGAMENVIPFITLKSEGEPLDINAISILLSDARQYRFNNFNSKLALQYDAGLDDKINVNYISYPLNDLTTIKEAYIDYLKQSSNPSDVLASKNEDSKIVLTSVFSEQDAINQYNDVISRISRIP
jgi:hypothetical protein